MIKKKRKHKKRLKHFFMGLLITIAVLAILFLIALKLFTVKKVVVEGNELYDQKTIEDAVLNDKYSWNSLYVYLKYNLKDTKKIPFIDTMSISLDSPHTLHISVYEKGMLGYIYIPGINENAYFDKDGFVVETSSDTVPGVPCIDGISCDKVVLYEKLPIKQTMLKDILELTQGLKRQDLVPDSVDYGAQNAPVAKYGNVSVIIGDTTKLTRKIERLKAIMPSLEGQSGTLHLESWTEETTNIVFDKSE